MFNIQNLSRNHNAETCVPIPSMLTEEQVRGNMCIFQQLWRFREAIARRFSVRENRHLITFHALIHKTDLLCVP
jgi:hypothetical protein